MMRGRCASSSTTDALPARLRVPVHRMIEDAEHYDHADLWVYRLFAWAPGQGFPEQRLHFVPVPTDIGPERLVNTTFRILHLSQGSAKRGAGRGSRSTSRPTPTTSSRPTTATSSRRPASGTAVARRPPGLPVLVTPAARSPFPTSTRRCSRRSSSRRTTRRPSSAQALRRRSAVQRAVRGDRRDERTRSTASIVRARFPDVRHVELRPRCCPGAGNAGLRIARGDFVSFPGSHVELPPGSLDARLQAHLAGWEMVTGTRRSMAHRRAAGRRTSSTTVVLPGPPFGRA